MQNPDGNVFSHDSESLANTPLGIIATNNPVSVIIPAIERHDLEAVSLKPKISKSKKWYKNTNTVFSR